MNRICDFMIGKSSKKMMIISTIVFVLFMIVVLPRVSAYTEDVTGSSNSPDTSLIYSSDDLFDIAETYGQVGRNAYIILRLTFDVIWPIVYFMFLASLTGFLLQKLDVKKEYKLLILLPLFGLIFDYLENIASVVVMYKYPIEMLFFANSAPVMTLLKWIFIGLGFICVILLLFMLLIKKVYKRIS